MGQQLLAWLMAHQTLVTWALAFLAALTALAAGYVQGWFALRGIRDQLKHADQRAIDQENRARAALLECLRVDLAILDKRLEGTQMQLEDVLRAPESVVLTAADLVISVPDTIAASWQDLARIPPQIVGPIRKLSMEINDLKELRAESGAVSDRKSFAEVALRRTKRATATLSSLREQVQADTTSPGTLIASAPMVSLPPASGGDQSES